MINVNIDQLSIAILAIAVVVFYILYITFDTKKRLDVLLENVENVEQIVTLVDDVAKLKTDPMVLNDIVLQSSNLQNCSSVTLMAQSGVLNAKTNIIFIQVSLQPTMENTPTSLTLSNLNFAKTVLLSCVDTGPAEITPSFSSGYLEFNSPLDPQQQTTITLTLLQYV